MQFNRIRIIFSGVIGNILEWYEFALYAYFATNIAQQFFPNTDKFLSLLNTFGVFAIGYLMRPLGAVFFGYFGDRFGRKKTLSISIILMAIATTSIGLIPSYQSIGMWAGVLLVLCRSLQGIAVGGEYSSSVVYIIEQAPAKQRGFFGSLSLFGGYFGMLLGSSVSTLVNHLAYGTPYYNYAWRFSFMIGLLLGVLGFYIRTRMPETPAFVEEERKHKLLANPVWDILRFHPTLVLRGVGITLLPAVASYTLFTYLPTHIAQYGSLSLEKALMLNTMALIVILIGIPSIGFLSDRFGRRNFLLGAPILVFMFSFLFFKMFSQISMLYVFIAQALLGLMYCCSEAVIPAFLASMFAVNQRCTGVALSLNIANGFFGGTAPLVATLLIQKTHNYSAPSIYIMAIAVIAMIATLCSLRIIARSDESPNIKRTVRFAENKDISGIMEVLESNLIANRKSIKKDILEQSGFLIHGFTAEEMQKFMADEGNYICLVSREQDVVIGYIIACDLRMVEAGLYEKLNRSPEKTLYYKHIAKLPNKKNVADKLLQFLVDEAKRRGYKKIVCLISEDPLENKPSKLFHEKFGFVKKGRITDEDLILSVWQYQVVST